LPLLAYPTAQSTAENAHVSYFYILTILSDLQSELTGPIFTQFVGIVELSMTVDERSEVSLVIPQGTLPWQLILRAKSTVI